MDVTAYGGRIPQIECEIIKSATTVSPTASAGLMCEGGEVALARAAARMGVPCTVATNSLTPLDEIVEAAELTKPDTQCWDGIKRIRDTWPGHMLVKGLQSWEDVVIAADYGMDGVVLSIHGGRYLDSAPAPLQVVPEVRRAVRDRLTIIIDSGARRGSDLVKAIGMGADLVMSGRPTLYGAAAAGEAGAYRALEIFQTEMDRIMAQLGLGRVDEISPHIFWNPPDWVARPRASRVVEQMASRACATIPESRSDQHNVLI